MAVERSKPRCFLKLIFIIKSHLRDKKPSVLMSALCILEISMRSKRLLTVASSIFLKLFFLNAIKLRAVPPRWSPSREPKLSEEGINVSFFSLIFSWLNVKKKKQQHLKFHSVGRKFTRVFSLFSVLDFSVILNLWLRVLGNKAILVTSHNSSNDGNSKSDG